MTRKRITHELISNESKRNATLLKRTEGLVKKANELSVLCGVDIAIVVHKNLGGGLVEDNAVLWPSPSMFRERLHRFFNFTNFERSKRKIVHERYMDQRISEEMECLSKLKRRVEIGESQLMGVNIERREESYNKYLDEVDLFQLEELISVADEMLEELDELELPLYPSPPPPPPPPPPPFFYSGDRKGQIIGGGGGGEASGLEFELGIDNLKNEQWFIDAMSDEQAAPPPPPLPYTGGAAGTRAAGERTERPVGGANVPAANPIKESATETPQ